MIKSFFVILENGSVQKSQSIPDDIWSRLIDGFEVLNIIDISNLSDPKIVDSDTCTTPFDARPLG